MKKEICVKISGLNLSRLLDKLILKNVLVNNVVKKGNTVRFCIDESELKTLDQICKKERKFYTIVYRNGFKQLISKLPFMFGGILALIIIYIYMFSFMLFVFDVDVSYSSSLPYDLSKVELILKENGIKSGMLRTNLNAKEIEKLLLLNIDDISGCTVKKIGGKVEICVFPSTEIKKPTESDLISKYDAVVTKVETYLGESNIKVGDIVKQGDVLIKNKNGAQGLIEGKVYFVSTAIYNENQQQLIPTGRIFRTRDVYLFNKLLIKDKNVCNFSTFLAEKCEFYVFDNYFLPIVCDETIYIETKLVNEVVPFEVVEGKITNEAYNDALQKVPDKSKVTNVSYSIVKDGSYTRVDCFIETEISLI